MSYPSRGPTALITLSRTAASVNTVNCRARGWWELQLSLGIQTPTAQGNCTACGTPVILRSDDTEDEIRTRLQEFEQKALPAIQVLTKDIATALARANSTPTTRGRIQTAEQQRVVPQRAEFPAPNQWTVGIHAVAQESTA